MIAGKTIISEDVFIELVKIATAKVEQVIIGAGQRSVLSVLAKSVTDRVAPQIHVKKFDAPAEPTDDTPAASVSFDLRINVAHGQNIPQTVAKVRESIKDEVERITGYNVEKIDILVEKLVKPAEPETAAAE